VARDGVVYEGSNYDPGMLNTLPWLGGFSLKSQGAGFLPIPNMTVVADLLARAQYEATHLYLNWQIVSLDRLEADREIEVTTKDGSRVVFTAKADFFPQLAKLDNILEHLRDATRFPTAKTARARIDLSLGREVPVMLEQHESRFIAPATTPSPALAPGFNVFPPSQPKSIREL
jgi:cell division protein FtsQ